MWHIIPLDLGTLYTVKCNIFHGETSRERIAVPNVAWLLTHRASGKKYLVEAGANEDDAWISKYHHPYKREREDQFLRKALEKHHTAPSEIEKIILTHLHWDHAYGPLLLPETPVVVQGLELRQAVDPAPRERPIYEVDLKEALPYFLGYFNRMELVHGDVTLDDGLSVVLLPGHSEGQQGVLIDADDGARYIIASDLINRFENLTEGPAGVLFDEAASYRSLDRIKTLGAKVIPSHDYRVFDMFRHNMI